MPVNVVLVHDEPDFLSAAAEALREAGHDVSVFRDPLTALDKLEVHRTEVLVSCLKYAPGLPHGISLARMVRYRHPKTKVIFTAELKDAPYTEGIGEFLPSPVDIARLVATVDRLTHRAGEIATPEPC
ncbi:MAG: hypothetical protein JO001_26145 [Alphaproteobacteria bacterium]|nr:hypothetical protein [Alphaproteobacteria bacterium]